MEIRHLRYFLAVAEQLHFARAAELLNISAPTLSVQIKEIEQQLGTQLFSRTKRSVQLTSAGQIFLAEARTTLAQFEQALTAGRRAGIGELGRVRVGYVGSAVFGGVLQSQLISFRSQWPSVHVDTQEWPMDQLIEAVVSEAIDIAYVRTPMQLPESLRQHMVLRDRFCIALPANHKLATRHTAILPAALRHEAFILPEQESGTMTVYSRGGFKPHSESRPGTLVEVLAEVSIAHGVAIVPSVLIQTVNLPNVIFKPIAGPIITSEVAAIYRKFEKAPAVKNMISALKKVAPQIVNL